MELEAGKTYRISHTRKGTFTLQITEVNCDWVSGIIAYGQTNAILAENVRMEGELTTMRKSFIVSAVEIPQIKPMNDAKVINELVDKDEKLIGYAAYCPGCDGMHVIWTNHEGYPKWSFNGDMVKPTFNPSLLLRAPDHGDPNRRCCHSFIRDGQWQFLNDCTHALAGKTVDMTTREAISNE